MPEERMHIYDYRAAREGETFHETLVDQLRRSPYFLISVAIHTLFIAIMWVTDFTTIKADEIKVVTANFIDERTDVLDEPIEEPEPEIPEEEDISEDPVVTDAPVPATTATEDYYPCPECGGACIKICPVSAIKKPERKGTYLLDKYTCTTYLTGAGGCSECLRVCPAGKSQ